MLAELALFARVAPGDSTWVVDGADVHVTLEKIEEGTWGRLEVSESEDEGDDLIQLWRIKQLDSGRPAPPNLFGNFYLT